MKYNIIRDYIAVLLIAVLVRGVYAYFFVELEYLTVEDQMFYLQLSQQLPESGILGIMPERLPGYPLFLAFINIIFGQNIWNIILIQIILDSISCSVIALIANLLFGKGFWIAGTLSAMNLNMVILSSFILPDTLFLFLFVMFLYYLINYLQNESIRAFVMLVLFISLATFVRPTSYYLLPVLLVSLVVWRLWQNDTVARIFMIGAIYVVVVGIVLGGIHQRNYQKYGSTAIVSQSGTHLLGWVIPAAYQYSGQGSYREGQSLAKYRLSSALQRDNLDSMPSDPFVSSAYQFKVGKEILVEFGFVNILKSWVVGSTINLLAPSIAYVPAVRAIEKTSFYETIGNGAIEKIVNYTKNSNSFLYVSVLFIGSAISTVFFVLSIFGALKAARILPPIMVGMLSMLLVYFLVITGPIIGVKYRLPIEPVMMLFVTYQLSRK